MSAAYTNETLAKAPAGIRQGGKSIRQISKEFNVPKTTLLNRISGRSTDEKKKRRPDPVFVAGDMKVVEWLINISKCGFVVKKEELLDTVKNIIIDG